MIGQVGAREQAPFDLKAVIGGSRPKGHESMRVFEVGDFATTGRLRMVERSDPAPGPGEVLVRIRSTGPNARDFHIMKTGMMGSPAAIAAHIPMCDLAGEVLELGVGVTQVALGDRVTMPHYRLWLDGNWDESMKNVDHAQTIDGFLRELAALPAEALIRIPDPISLEDAGTLPSAGLTAWNAVIEAGNIQPGETLVTIGTGGVSVFAAQWGKMMGARVIVTSSSDEKIARMKEIGADDGINYRTHPDWHKAVMELTGGKGANLVLNNVGMAELDSCLESCTSGGRIMSIGASPVNKGRTWINASAPKRLGLLILRDLTLKGVIVGSRRMFVNMLDAMVEHNVRPVIDRYFNFDDVNEALDYAAMGYKLGKIVIRV